MIKTLIVLSGILLFNSCVDQTVDNKDFQYPLIYEDSIARIQGQWFWVSSSGGIDGGTISPTVENQIRLHYSKDSVFQYIRNNSVMSTSNYSIRKSKSIYRADSIDFIFYSDFESHKEVILKLTKDSLILADNYFDGHSSIYIKVGL